MQYWYRNSIKMASNPYFNGGHEALAQALRECGVEMGSETETEDSEKSSTDESYTGGLLHRNFLQEILSGSTRQVESDVESAPPARKRRRQWRWKRKLPYTTSMFFRDYHSPLVKILTTSEAKAFRLDYRMPWSEVNKLVNLFVDRGWVASQRNPAHQVTRNWWCPPEIKILGVLYWLGEGCTFRTIYNLSGRVLSQFSFCKFAKKFCAKMAQVMSKEWIKMPANVEELTRISNVYASKGFPGACGSVDGVQIGWEGCPFAYRTSFTGKEGYATLGFNVSVTHDMRIVHVVSTFAGRFNDKTKLLHDDYVRRLRDGFYSGFEYEVFDAEGRRHVVKIPYVICDNGYHRWLQMMCPFKTTSIYYLALWSKLLESLRKDVERTFGVMKKRFRILKVPLLFREASFVQDIFVCCAVLHNMLLEYDHQFDDGNFRYGVGPEITRTNRRQVLLNNVRRLLRVGDDYSFMGRECEEALTTEVDSGFDVMRKKLAVHTYYCFLQGLIVQD